MFSIFLKNKKIYFLKKVKVFFFKIELGTKNFHTL